MCFHTFTRGFSHRHRCRRHRRRSVFPCGGFAVFIRSLYYGRTTLEGSVFQGGGQRFMGVPKTIDNDLMVTDHTPGYGSAAKYIGVVMKEIIRDATVYGTKYDTGSTPTPEISNTT